MKTGYSFSKLFFIGVLLLTTGFANSGQWSPARALPQKAGVQSVLVKVNNWGLNNTVSLSYQVPQPSFTARFKQRIAAEKEEKCIVGNAVPVYI